MFGSKMFLFHCRKRGERTRNSYGEWKAKEGAQAENDLLEFPARRAAEALPEDAVSGAAGESRARRFSGPHTDSGECH